MLHRSSTIGKVCKCNVLFLILVSGTKQSQIEAKLVKDGKPLPLKEVEVVTHEDKITFTVKKPARGLTGKYQIKISNAQGEDVKDITINMQGEIYNLLLKERSYSILN